jgi:hypothetical protein
MVLTVHARRSIWMNVRPEVTGKATPQHTVVDDDDRMLTFNEWCERNSFSLSTGQRLRASGQGPVFVQLSTRRIGVSIAEDRRWRKAREIATAA